MIERYRLWNSKLWTSFQEYTFKSQDIDIWFLSFILRQRKLSKKQNILNCCTPWISLNILYMGLDFVKLLNHFLESPTAERPAASKDFSKWGIPMLIKPWSCGKWQWWSMPNAPFWEGVVHHLLKCWVLLGFYIYFDLVVLYFPLLFSLDIYRNVLFFYQLHIVCIIYIYIFHSDCLACLGRHWSQCPGYYTLTRQKVGFRLKELFSSDHCSLDLTDLSNLWKETM